EPLFPDGQIVLSATVIRRTGSTCQIRADVLREYAGARMRGVPAQVADRCHPLVLKIIEARLKRVANVLGIETVKVPCATPSSPDTPDPVGARAQIGGRPQRPSRMRMHPSNTDGQLGRA